MQVLSQTEIDKLLNNSAKHEEPPTDDFLNDMEMLLKKPMKSDESVLYTARPKLVRHFVHDPMGRKLDKIHVCEKCNKQMRHIFVFRPGGGGRTLQAWCEKCNFYHPI